MALLLTCHSKYQAGGVRVRKTLQDKAYGEQHTTRIATNKLCVIVSDDKLCSCVAQWLKV